MNRIVLFLFTVMVGTCILTSCSDNDDVDLAGVEVTNAELKAMLKQKGFTFNEEDKLVQDDKVKNTTTLDLSGCNLTDVSGLGVFPNLTEVNLSDNKFSFSFDLSMLPASVNSVDLTGNEIYEYPGLVKVITEENGDETVTVLRELKKLYLPEGAKYNCDDLVSFYTTNKTVIDNGSMDMKMANNSGSLINYNTLREVPDEVLREFLLENFPSMFDGDHINIARRMVKANEANANLVLTKELGNENIEGVQYIVMNNSYKGGQIVLMANNSSELKYLKIKPELYKLKLSKINTGYMNLSNAANLCFVNIDNNDHVEQLDVSASTLFGQRSTEYEFAIMDNPSEIRINNCPRFKTIIYPQKAKYLCTLSLYNLPLLEEVNLSQYRGMNTLELGGLNGLKKVTYFTPDGYYGFISPDKKGVMFGISPEIYEFSETKTFLDEYHENFVQLSFPRSTGVSTYKWANDYK